MLLVAIPLDIAIAQAKWEALSTKERGTRIHAALIAKGSTKTGLAERLGVSFNTVQSWIVGAKEADWARWMAVCLALGLEEKWEPSAKDLAAAQEHKATRGPKPKKKRAVH